MLDSNTLSLLTTKFLIAALILVRVSGMFASAQFWSNEGIPTQVKMILAIILTVAIAGPFWNEQLPIDYHLWNLVFLSIKELMVGVAIGFSTNIVFWAARFGGGLIDFDMGYQTSSLFDKDSGSPTLVGEFYYLAALMVFLYMNGHHFIIEALFMSVRAVPINTMEFSGATITLFIKLATSIMILGMKIAAPVMISLFCVNLALALLARMAPQTNIFTLSFQFKIGVGLLVLFVSVPLLVLVLKLALTQMQTETMNILLSLNPARA